MTALDVLQHRLRAADGHPDGTIVLFHGRGADEHDLFGLLDALDPHRRLLGVCPRAPMSLPPGGAHWYAVRHVGFPDPDTFMRSFELAGRWLDALAGATGIPIARTVLGGFSQGAVMAWSLALGRDRPRPAGVLSFSGFLPEVAGFELNVDDSAGLPVAVGHGAYDPVIGVEFSRSARDRLHEAGAEVVYRETPMQHAIDPEFVRDLVPWVARVARPGAKDQGASAPSSRSKNSLRERPPV